MPNDILLDDNYDLLIQDGDFVVGESTRQHQALILLCEKGEIREFPTRGLGLRSWLNDDIEQGDINIAIKREFEADGMKVLQVSANGENINVEGEYE